MLEYEGVDECENEAENEGVNDALPVRVCVFVNEPVRVGVFVNEPVVVGVKECDALGVSEFVDEGEKLPVKLGVTGMHRSTVRLVSSALELTHEN